MALTERYVTVSGAGANTGVDEANAFTFAQMITDMATPRTGYRYNVKAGSYSSGAVSLTAGTVSLPNVIRGYNSTIGDLDNQGRNADGSLNTSNMPDLTLTGTLTSAVACYLQNLDITGALSTFLVGSTSVDEWGIMQCRITNTQNNASASCVRLDDRCVLLNSDMELTGAAHSYCAEMDINGVCIGCRFKGVESGEYLLSHSGGVIEANAFFGASGSHGILLDLGLFNQSAHWISKNTFYGIDTCIALANTAPVSNSVLVLIENHATDCSKWLNNLYSATANITTIEIRNRLRDITTARTGIEEIKIGEIDTDTGDASTDYNNAGAEDFHLITTAAGYNAGIDGGDIGAYQTDPPSGGGGGGPLIGGRLVR